MANFLKETLQDYLPSDASSRAEMAFVWEIGLGVVGTLTTAIVVLSGGTLLPIVLAALPTAYTCNRAWHNYEKSKVFDSNTSQYDPDAISTPFPSNILSPYISRRELDEKYS